jgi:hypothetical protein
MEQAKAQEQSQRLGPSLQKTEPKKILVWVATMALRRGCSLSPEELELRRDDLLNPRNYAVQLAGRDVAVEPADFDEALHTLGTAPREQYEQAWPSLDTCIAAVLEAGKKRRIAESKSRMLTDGRRDGETVMEQWKREADTDAPDAELKARMDRMNAKLAMKGEKKPTQPAQASTPPPAPASVSVGDMQPDECDAFVTFLETMSFESFQAALRAAGTVQCEEDQAAVARALRALWLSKGKDARNLVTLAKKSDKATTTVN